MDIPYPSQHTMSSNNRHASEMPFKFFRCFKAKKEERKAGEGVCVGGGGVGDRLESPVETHSIFAVFCLFFFLHVVLLFLYGWGGGKLLLI